MMGMSPENVWALLWGGGGQFHELHVAQATCWIGCGQRRPFTRLLHADDVKVSLVPRTARDALSLGAAHVLWARLESPACAPCLSRLPVAPSLVVREGGSSRRWALWALSRPLRGDWITHANERLSHACQGRRGAADASTLFPSPFTRLTNKARPVRVYAEFESATYATARQIVGRLRDAPATDGWRLAA
jgi:hypothetical protein